MKYAWLFIMLLVACVPEFVPPQAVKENTTKEEVQVILPVLNITPAPIFTRAIQTINNITITYGYDDKGRLSVISSPERTTVLKYNKSNILLISDGNSTVEFLYEDSVLHSVRDSRHLTRFTFFGDNIVHAKNDYEYRFTYSDNNILTFQRDEGVKTIFEYNNESIKTITKGPNVADVYWDDRGRIKHIELGETNLILAYWRENKLSAMSGKLYGLGETISYNQEDVQIVSNKIPTVFSGFERERTAELYIRCKKLRRIELFFDPIDYIVQHYQYNFTVTDFIKEGYLCQFVQ